MKRIFILLPGLLFFIFCYGQNFVATPVVFRQIEYYKGTDSIITYDTIRAGNQKIDLAFYKKHFNMPYSWPESFIDKKYRDTTLSIWHNGNPEGDFEYNWLRTRTYNSFSQLINFSYSGCIGCNDLAYNYSVSYTKDGLVSSITSNSDGNDDYHFLYNNDGQIKEVDCYRNKAIASKIILIK